MILIFFDLILKEKIEMRYCEFDVPQNMWMIFCKRVQSLIKKKILEWFS